MTILPRPTRPEPSLGATGCTNLYVRHPATRALVRLEPTAPSMAALRKRIQACVGVPPSAQGVLRCERQRRPIQTPAQIQALGSLPDATVLELTFAQQGRAGLLGGKGGFGSLLRSLAKNTSTTNFGSCRDLQGRRLRHVQQEEELQRWQEEQARKGPQKASRDRQKEYLALKTTGRFLEKRMCTFGADCRYKWKCRYRHPGDDEAEKAVEDKRDREKQVQGPLKQFFGHANKPLKGVIGVTSQKKTQNDIVAGLKMGGGKTRGLKRRRVGLRKRKKKSALLPVVENEEVEEPAPKRAKPSSPALSDDDDFGFEIADALPSSCRTKARGGSWGEKAADLKTLVPTEKDVIIPIDADFDMTRKRAKKERRRRHREREAQLRAEKEKKMVGGWMVEQKEAPAVETAPPDDMFLGDLFNDGGESEKKSATTLPEPTASEPAATGGAEKASEEDPAKNEDEIDLDGLL